MTRGVPVAVLLALSVACSQPSTPAATADTSATPAPGAATSAPAAAPAAAKPEEEFSTPVYETVLPEDLRSVIDTSFTGDFDEMVKRRIIRVGVTFNRTFYFIDKGTQRGLSYEYMTQYEEQLN